MTPGDLRPYLEFLVLEFAPHVNNVTANAFTAIRQSAIKLQDKTTLNLGMVPTSEGNVPEGVRQMAKSTEDNQSTWAAAQVLNDAFSLPPLWSAKIGKGQTKVTAPSSSYHTLVVTWDVDDVEDLTYHWMDPGTTLSLSSSSSSVIANQHFLQLNHECAAGGNVPERRTPMAPAPLPPLAIGAVVDQVARVEGEHVRRRAPRRALGWPKGAAEVAAGAGVVGPAVGRPGGGGGVDGAHREREQQQGHSGQGRH